MTQQFKMATFGVHIRAQGHTIKEGRLEKEGIERKYEAKFRGKVELRQSCKNERQVAKGGTHKESFKKFECRSMGGML
jgi:hypothetical protein